VADGSKPQQRQVNIRVDDDMLERIDEVRAGLRRRFSNIPSRSDIIRMAIEGFLREHEQGGEHGPDSSRG